MMTDHLDVFNLATYHIFLCGRIVSFKIGDVLSDNDIILKNSVFITANNPKGVTLKDSTNEELNNKLLNEVVTDFNYLTGVGGDVSHIEYHYLFLGMSPTMGHSLGIKYQQLAYIYIDDNLRVNLLTGI